MNLLDQILDVPARLGAHVARTIGATLLVPSSEFAVGSLIVALIIATLWLTRRHIRSGASIRAAALARLLFPSRWWKARSSRLDLQIAALNLFVFGIVFAGAVLSHQVVSAGTKKLLSSMFGPAAATALMPEAAAAAVLTLALFLAYELAYWLYHYLSHTIPILWEMHKVHHSAEVLTPLTNSRVHPVEGLLLLNTMAVIMGLTDGLVTYGLGGAVHPFTIAGGNLLVVAGTYLIAHLHHTHVWIPFTGFWGRLFISPAHHQIHHSTNPVHFNKNMGSVLAVWDWLFGTLHMPSRERERLTFGIGDGEVTEHSVTRELFRPIHALTADRTPETTSPVRP